MINWHSILAWGFVATSVLSVIEAIGRWMGWTRISIHFLVGTMFTGNRDKAAWIGIPVHMLNGWIAAIGYGLILEAWRATWWTGLLLGLLHGGFVLAVAIPAMPGLHPRMASERHGPDPTPLLQPPGFMALNYGRGTTIITMIAHIMYGTILGLMYEPVK